MTSEIAKRIAERREELNMSRKDLAELLNTSESQIWRYEKGSNDPTGETILKLSRCLQTNPNYLLGVTESKMAVFPSKKKYILNTPFLKLYHRIHSIDDFEADVIEELRKKTPEARQKALDIIKLL